jgi:carbonic anhydrase
MGRSSNEEIAALKEAILEKNQLIAQQMSLINEHIETLTHIGDVKRKLEICEKALLEKEVCLRELESENDRIKRQVLKIRSHPFIRMMRWFRDDI